ncbi:hypothetical protein HMPREF0762_00675 [Slackia exigua ATCC 700122]|uniref:Uncharacterized protein n=1 Tax=Slackia exigua (strain ATCC 700122 / DSM 15923 / CIP 105133 / JCM 11022 / KCTC 5966 / S-7) TaxID=649764 RepID=D0WFS4_SLAES|nr:hypothetical protein HMPREF0762_00675 [Slackia exigua ATCC 700122]
MIEFRDEIWHDAPFRRRSKESPAHEAPGARFILIYVPHARQNCRCIANAHAPRR